MRISFLAIFFLLAGQICLPLPVIAADTPAPRPTVSLWQRLTGGFFRTVHSLYRQYPPQTRPISVVQRPTTTLRTGVESVLQDGKIDEATVRKIVGESDSPDKARLLHILDTAKEIKSQADAASAMQGMMKSGELDQTAIRKIIDESNSPNKQYFFNMLDQAQMYKRQAEERRADIERRVRELEMEN